MSGLLQDVRYALRQLRKGPGFTCVAVLTLALGIGATTAIFSLVYTLMRRSLPVRDPGQLVELLHRYPGEPHFNGFSRPAYEHMRDHNHVFSALVAAVYQPLHLRSESMEPQRVNGAYVDGTFFEVLGVKPVLGRLLEPNDDRISNPADVAVVSWSYWKTRFNLDPAILGKQITVESMPITIIGVASPQFRGLQVESSQDIWLPLAMRQVISRSGIGWDSLSLVARLKHGVSIEQARAEMEVLYHSTLDEQARATNNPFIRGMKLEMQPAGAGLSRLREEWEKPLLLLMGFVGLLLLIACTNLASLLLARGAGREHEMALRLSLGAGHLRLARQALTESLVLSVIGSLFGVFFAYFGADMLVRLIVAERRPGPPIDFHARIDAHVLLFTATIALLCVIFSGLVPALRATRATPISSLRQAGVTGATRFQWFFGKSLVVAQVALSLVLLSAAGLFARHLMNLESLNLGFQRDHILLVTLDPTGSGQDNEHLSRDYQELLPRLQAIPGVRAVTICAASPISGAGANRGINVEGYQVKPGEIRNVMENWVAPKYFATVSTPLLVGRDFSLQDKNGPPVAIINQTMARYYFGDRSPIGKHVTFDGNSKPYEIVGVVGDAKYMDMREATWRTIYLDTFQERWVASQFVLRTSIDPLTLAPEVQRAVRELLKTNSVTRVTTLEDQVNASIIPERLITTLSLWSGAIAASLAAIGIYGLLAYTVARRINEIGLRIALGATRNEVIRMVLRGTLGILCAGVAIGTPIAFWGKSLAASFIPDLPVTDPVPITFGVAGMIAVALLASYIPARRATKVDPMVALRYE